MVWDATRQEWRAPCSISTSKCMGLLRLQLLPGSMGPGSCRTAQPGHGGHVLDACHCQLVHPCTLRTVPARTALRPLDVPRKPMIYCRV
jgi:hypothetical protein